MYGAFVWLSLDCQLDCRQDVSAHHHPPVHMMMRRTHVQNRQARKESLTGVIGGIESVIMECDSMMIEERFVANNGLLTNDNSATMDAILSRDQRTTIHRVIDRCRKPAATHLSFNKSSAKSLVSSCNNGSRQECKDDFIMNLHPGVLHSRTIDNFVKKCSCRVSSCDPCLVTRSRCKRGIGTPRFDTSVLTWLRLGTLLLTFFNVLVNSAPMNREDRRLDLPPKWVNPCGLAAEDFEGDQDVVQLSDIQLLGQVVLQAKTALMHAQLFRDDYIREILRTELDDLQASWKKQRYDWLPSFQEIPKHLGERLNQNYLNALEIRMLDTILLRSYEFMQKFAVGLEQIVWDQEDYNLLYRQQFKDSEFQLRTVLCELQVALIERTVPLRPDVLRSVMPGEYRMAKDNTSRNLRDWLIFRDYMNGLEYIVQVFEHFLQMLES